MDFIKLAEAGPIGAVIALAGVIYLIVKMFINRLDVIDKRHQKSYDDITTAIKGNTRITNKLYDYLVLRNGSIEEVLKKVCTEKELAIIKEGRKNLKKGGV